FRASILAVEKPLGGGVLASAETSTDAVFPDPPLDVDWLRLLSATRTWCLPAPGPVLGVPTWMYGWSTLFRSTSTRSSADPRKSPVRRRLSRRLPGIRRIPAYSVFPVGANRTVMSCVAAPGWLGTIGFRLHVWPPSDETKMGAFAPPSGSGVKADA